MGISRFEMYHGAVLTQIVRNPEISLKLIERDSAKHGWGMYSIASGSKDYVIFIKSTSKIYKAKRTQEDYSGFTFAVEHIDKLKQHLDKNLLVCLVCYDQNICLLTQSDIEELKLLDSKKSCRIAVYWKYGLELRVISPFTELSHRVARNRLKNYDWEK